MNAFVNSVTEQLTTTENGMPARVTSANHNLDFFYNSGASRGITTEEIIKMFSFASNENLELAVRNLLHTRDVRNGKGERRFFREILLFLEKTDSATLEMILKRIPDLGRFDDGFVLKTKEMRLKYYAILEEEIDRGNGLVFKWLPREKSSKNKFRHVAFEFMRFLEMTPKQYRKFLVENTKVVEQKMCAGEWDEINFNHVPSQAMHIYRTAFYKRTPNFEKYINDLSAGKTGVKINAGAIYPHQLSSKITSLISNMGTSPTEIAAINAQWQALPDFVTEEAAILPMIDVSGSMYNSAGGTSVTCKDVAIGLGLYTAERIKGSFKNMFLSFAGNPKLIKINGNNIVDNYLQVSKTWDGAFNTNLQAAIRLVLKHAVSNDVPQEDMPKILMIFSDMQFDPAWYTRSGKGLVSATEMMKKEYEEAGYLMPTIVYWNLRKTDNVPGRTNDAGIVMVSGFSPSMIKPILEIKPEECTPEAIMLHTLMDGRYDWNIGSK